MIIIKLFPQRTQRTQRTQRYEEVEKENSIRSFISLRSLRPWRSLRKSIRDRFQEGDRARAMDRAARSRGPAQAGVSVVFQRSGQGQGAAGRRAVSHGAGNAGRNERRRRGRRGGRQ